METQVSPLGLVVCGGSEWEAPASSLHPQSPARGQQALGDKPVSCRGHHSAPDTRASQELVPCFRPLPVTGPQPLPSVTPSWRTSGNCQAQQSLKSHSLLVKSSGPRHRQPPVCPSSPKSEVQVPTDLHPDHLPRGWAHSTLPVTPPAFLPLDGVLPWGHAPPLRLPLC